MRDAIRFRFTAASGVSGEGGLLPQLPITLAHQGGSVEAAALLDTGATVNVLPFHTGAQLGAEWKQENATIKLTGNLADFEACPLIVSATVGQFDLCVDTGGQHSIDFGTSELFYGVRCVFL